MNITLAAPACALFGLALAEARKQAGISQSRLGMLAECNLSNLRLIEKGEIQAGVTTALRLLCPLNVKVDIFFDQLAEKSGILSAQGLCSFCAWPLPLLDADFLAPDENNSPIKAQFGRLFKKARTLCRVSQRTAASSAGYHQRNLYNVEQRGQEPGIITAMTMVASIGYPPGYFFRQLNARIQKIMAIKLLNYVHSYDNQQDSEKPKGHLSMIHGNSR